MTRLDYAASIEGLALAVRSSVSAGDEVTPVRQAAELSHRFNRADEATKHEMLAAEPPHTGHDRWDAFLGGLAEWLAVRSGLPAPGWVYKKDRYLNRGWWVTKMRSMQAWEYAGSPMSFKHRGVYLHRESLTNV